MNTPILMTEEYWRNSQFSVARHYGGIKVNGIEYIIVNEMGENMLECVIERGEPADLIDKRYLPIYRKVGRENFMEWVRSGMELGQMKEKIKEMKGNKE